MNFMKPTGSDNNGGDFKNGLLNSDISKDNASIVKGKPILPAVAVMHI